MATDPYRNWSLEYWKRIAAEIPGYQVTTPQGVVPVEQLISAMERTGATYSFQMYGQDAPISNSPKTFGDQFKQFVTNPAFLVALGGVAGVAGAGAGAGAAAGEGAYGAGYGVGNATTAGAAGAGAGAAGTGAASVYGAGGEFGSGATTYGSGAAGGTTLAEQSAAIGSGSTAGTSAGTGVGTGAGTVGGTATTAAGSTALQRILAGNGTDADYLSVVGQVAPSLLSAYGSYQQAGDYKDLANKYMAMGAPYRDELSRISADPNAFYTSPTATKATEAVLQRLSSQYGNPAGNPYAQSLTIDALYDKYGSERDRLAGYGGLTQYNAAAPGAAGTAINAEGSVYGDIGYGIGNVMSPQPSLAKLLQQYGVSGGSV